MKPFKIQVRREGRWWMVEIPALDGLTQARRLGEAELMAREWIALSTNHKLSDVTVETTAIKLADGTDVLSQQRAIRQARTEAERSQKHLADLTRTVARELVDSGVPLRDAGAAIGISAQRVAQLV